MSEYSIVSGLPHMRCTAKRLRTINTVHKRKHPSRFPIRNASGTEANKGVFTLAAELGLEPRQTVPETGVLPLHNSAIYCVETFNARYYSKVIFINQALIPSKGFIRSNSASLSLTLPMSSNIGILFAGFLNAKAG